MPDEPPGRSQAEYLSAQHGGRLMSTQANSRPTGPAEGLGVHR